MDYGAEVTRRFEAPGAGGGLPAWSGKGVVGEAEDRSLNIWVRFYVEPAGDLIGRIGFEVYGCPHTIAAASRVAGELEGAHRDALRSLDMRRICAELDVPTEKLGKLLRIEDAVKRCSVELDKQEMKGLKDGSIAN
jgi:NifU-like protein involved in Fe-S cluster formation